MLRHIKAFERKRVMMIAKSMKRLGTESAFEVSARVAALRAQGHHVINLGIGQPDFKTAPHIIEAAVKALRDGHHGYTDSKGIISLRETVAGYIDQRYQVHISPESVLIVPGGKVTMFLAISMLAEPGCEVIYPNPGFPIYESVIKYVGATAVPLPLEEENQFSFKAEDLLSRITDKTSLIIINNPSNPTGGVTQKAEYDKFVDGLEKFPHVMLLVDEIYDHQIYDHAEFHSFLRYEHLADRMVILNGWSKTWAMTGWRLGYGVWPKNLIKKATDFCVNIHSCVNAAAQYAAIAAMEGPQDAVHHMLKEFDERRKFILEKCRKSEFLHCAIPKGAFYAFPNIKKCGHNSKYWQDRFLENAHVGMIAGTSFGDYGEGYLRISYAASFEEIEESLRRIENLLIQDANDGLLM